MQRFAITSGVNFISIFSTFCKCKIPIAQKYSFLALQFGFVTFWQRDISPMYLCAQIPKAQKDTYDLTVFLRFWDLHTKKASRNGEINPRWQFQEHFTVSCFKHKYFTTFKCLQVVQKLGEFDMTGIMSILPNKI